MTVLKTLILTGVSDSSWEDAARGALKEAALTIKSVEWMEVERYSAKVHDNNITEYRATVKITFKVENGMRHGH